MTKQFEEIIREGNSFYELFKIAECKFVEKNREWDLIDPKERSVILIGWYTMELCGGGIDQVLLGSVCDHYYEFIQILQVIGATITVEQFKVAEEQWFGGEVPTCNIEREEKLLSAQDALDDKYWDMGARLDEFLYSGDECLEDLLVSHLRKEVSSSSGG